MPTPRDEPPPLRRDNTLRLGKAEGFRGRELSLPAPARERHMYVCGASGSGKSKLLEALIRQDLTAWPGSGRGLVLLDPHGSLYHAVLAWLVRHPHLTRGRRPRPVVPLDFSARGEGVQVPTYNLLRERGGKGGGSGGVGGGASVVLGEIIRAIAHVWGAGGTDQTPLFRRWVYNVLLPLYVNGCPLTDAPRLLRQPLFRRRLLGAVGDENVRWDWEAAERLPPKEFEATISSTVNRLLRFLTSERLQLVFGPTPNPTLAPTPGSTPNAATTPPSSNNGRRREGRNGDGGDKGGGGGSFDWRRALDEGWIVLVNLSTEGGSLSSEDASTLGTLLLTDLWTTARERGKAVGNKGFYVYADEFQRFVTPDIAESLDEARGYGLYLTLAHQFPTQLLQGGESGERVYHSILGNAANKLVFRTQHPKDLETLAQWLFRDVLDPDEIKHELKTTKVLRHKFVYHKSYHESRGESYGGSEGESVTEGESHSTTSGLSMPVSQETGLVEELAGYLSGEVGGDEGDDEGEGGTATQSESEGEGYTKSHTWTGSSSWSTSHSEGTSLSPMLVPEMGEEVSSVQFRPLEEQLHRAMAVLSGQETRAFVAKLDGVRMPLSVVTPYVGGEAVSPEAMRETLGVLSDGWPFLTPIAEARERLEVRRRELDAWEQLTPPEELEGGVRAGGGDPLDDDEAFSYRRRVV